MSKSGKKSMWQVYKPFLVQYMTPQWCLIMGGILAGVLAAASAGFGLPAMIQYVFPIVFWSLSSMLKCLIILGSLISKRIGLNS